MKNYLNYIKESKEQEDLVRVCIEKEVFKPITLIKDINIKDYLEENFTKFKPSSVKKCLAYFNLNIEKINKVYAFLDKIFSKFKVDKSNNQDLIYYKYNDKYIAYYNKNNNIFYYHYDKIYKVLNIEFKLNEDKINELISCKVEDYLKIKKVIPSGANDIIWSVIKLYKNK